MRRALLPVLVLSACAAPPDLSEAFNQVQVQVARTDDSGVDPFVQLIESAQESLHIAIPAGQDVRLTDPIIEAWQAGLEVEVITDISRSEEPGIADLLEAGVPVQLASDGIEYFDFNIKGDVSWSAEQTLMMHAYAVADRRRAVAANRVGHLEEGTRIVLQLQGERIIEDLLSEHNQVFGGMDATATTSFSGLAKSIVDFRWRYPTSTDVDLEMWFGPQERLVKRVIDATYSARGSVWVLTDDFTDRGLARALQEKAAWGFDVRVVVGPHFGESNIVLSRVLAQETPDVDKRRVTDVDTVPTMVIVDWEPGLDGKRYPTRIFVLNHDLYSAFRLHLGREILTDQLIDGTLWGLVDYDEPSAEMKLLHEVWTEHYDRGGSL